MLSITWKNMMEHRYYPRLEASLKVGVFKDDEFLGYYETRNVSLDGISLKMASLEFERNDVIGLLISISGQSHLQKGVVVHASQTIVGIMYLDVSKEIFQSIFNMFKAVRIPLSRLLHGIDRRMPAERQLALPRATADGGSHKESGSVQSQREFCHIQSKGLVIRIGRRLDISSTMQFKHALNTIHHQAPKIVVIDLADTEHLFDSGLALLMLLLRGVKNRKHRFYLINGNSQIVDRLSTSPVAAAMQIL